MLLDKIEELLKVSALTAKSADDVGRKLVWNTLVRKVKSMRWWASSVNKPLEGCQHEG